MLTDPQPELHPDLGNEAEPISPELALVDPELARRAREALPSREPSSLLERAPARPQLWVVPPPQVAPRRPGRLLAHVLAAVLVGTVALRAWTDHDPELEVSRPAPSAPSAQPSGPAEHSRSAIPQGTAPSPRLRERAGRGPRLAPASPPAAASSTTSTATGGAPSLPRRPLFIWTPVAGAKSYRVVFFRGGKKVYEASTSRPRHTLPLTWSFGGKRHRLTKGEYRWRVVPRLRGRSGLREGPPVVDSTYTV